MLEDVQDEVQSLLQSDAGTSAIPCLLNDGNYPSIDGREDALAGYGVVLIVWPVDCFASGDVDFEGKLTVYDAAINVLIEENVSVNRAQSGHPTALKVARLVKEALQGQLGENITSRAIRPFDPWFKNFGQQNGIQRVLTNFTRQLA